MEGTPKNQKRARYGVSKEQTNVLPRFYHMEGDDGYWLPSYGDDVKVQFIEPKEKINLFGPSYFYLECAGLNCIDETSPYEMNEYNPYSLEKVQ